MKIIFLKILLHISFIGLILSLGLLTQEILYAQQIDILLKGGHVIDPANNIDELMDVAISQNKIVEVAVNIAVFNMREGNFGFIDVRRKRIDGTRKLETEITIRNGRIDCNLN